MSGFDYLMARGNPKTPATSTADSFDAFAQAILAKRVQISITADMTKEQRRAEKRKLFWFSPPTQQIGQRRIAANMAPCAFGGADIDGSTPEAIRALTPVLKRYSVLAYQTASNTDTVPRLRIVPEYSRLVAPAERSAVGGAVEALLMQEAGFTLASLEGEKAKWTKGDDYVSDDN